jgi:hypothetical protein
MVTDVTTAGVTTWRREILERGPKGTEDVGTINTSISNPNGWMKVGQRNYSPYVPVLGPSAQTGAGVTPGSTLQEFTFTNTSTDAVATDLSPES